MTRLALVLGGSASLGAYSGGAVSEILRALQRNRREEAVEVRVVTGASSGALAAATAARSLVVNPEVVPWADRFWLEGFRAEHLLNPRRSDRGGLLDVRPLEEMVGQLVDGPAAADDRPGSALGRSLRLGLCLTDLAGTPSGPDSDRYARTARFDLDPARGAGDAVWEQILETALASASVPLAFPLRRLARGAAAGADAGGSERHWTGDGVAAERPLTLAREMAADFRDHAEADWRYVVVEPRLGREGTASEPPAGVADTARLLARAMLGRGAELDLLETAEEEERAGLLRALVRRLPEIHGRLEDADAVGLGRQIGQLAEQVAEWEVSYDEDEPGDPALDHLDRSLQLLRDRPEYAPAFREVESRAGRTRLAKLVLVLEAAAGLRNRAGHPVHLVSPDRPLAGERLAGFGGVLEPSWRAADFTAGRRDARALLEGPLSDAVEYRPDPDEAYRTEGPARELGAQARALLERHLEAEVDRVLEEVRPGGVRGLFFGLVRPALRQSAARRALKALRCW